MKTRTQCRAFAATLERETTEEIQRQLRQLGMDELCALNEFAGRRLKQLIQQEMRSGEGEI